MEDKKPTYPKQLKHLQTNIKKFGKLIKYPDKKCISSVSDIDLDSWVKSNLFTSNQKLFTNFDNIKYDELKGDGYMTKQIELYPTDNQKKIFDQWFISCVLMYNETIKYIRTNRFNKTKFQLSIGYFKKALTSQKEAIYKKSKLNVTIDGKQTITHINKHILDYAINDAVNRYKSCLTNLRNGNIKHFTLRYLKLTKPNKTFKIENILWTHNSFCTSVIGKILLCSIKDFDYSNNIHTVAIITKRKNKYVLLLKYPKSIDNSIDKKDTVTFDGGIRTFLSGLANNEVLEIGTNMQADITARLKQIDRIQTLNMSKGKKKKIVQKKYDKIKNRVNDIHWKIINYLITNYKNILIGNFSTKSMCETKINSMIKRVGSMYSFFTFKQKLMYKCQFSNINYKEVDEKYTTQCCSNCGNRKTDLGASKIYDCKKCGKVMDRDWNSIKDIYLAALN